jgi:hypothetical protein
MDLLVRADIKNIILLISAADGRVFGGYVRRVAAHTANGLPDKAHPLTTDIDAWFPSVTAMRAFLVSLSGGFRIRPLPGGSAPPGIFQKETIEVEISGNKTLSLDLLVSPSLPASDFETSFLTFHINRSNAPVFTSHLVGKSDMELIESIRRKEATILPSYLEKVERDPEERQRVADKYIHEGWRILTPPRTLNL